MRQCIEAFTTEFHHCTIALTCRIAAREYAFERFTEVEIADFTKAQVEIFAKRWFGLQGEERKARAFIEKLEANQPIFELASSPLLLTLLCLVFQERNDFDGTRSELYREGLDILLRKWDAKRGIERDRPYGLNVTDMEHLLGEIAYRRFLKSEYFFDQSSLEKQIEDFFMERDLLEPRQEFRPDRVLDSAESHLGLLVQRAMRVYSFSHLSFQEYLTAQRVAKKRTLLSEIGPYVWDRRWREVWLLLVTMVDADDIIPELKTRVDMLVVNQPMIQLCLEWCFDKGKQGGTFRPSAQRAFYLALARAFDRELFTTFEHALHTDRDFDNYFSHGLAFDGDLSRDVDVSLALQGEPLGTDADNLNNVLAHDYNFALDYVLCRLIALAHARWLDLTHGRTIDSRR